MYKNGTFHGNYGRKKSRRKGWGMRFLVDLKGVSYPLGGGGVPLERGVV